MFGCCEHYDKQGGDMKDLWIRNKKNKFGLKSKILLGGLALAVIIGLGTAAHGASDNTNNKNKLLLGQMSLFDPFTLQSTRVSAARSESKSESDPGMDIILLAEAMKMKPQPPIRIPFRPALRSPFRPPLVLR